MSGWIVLTYRTIIFFSRSASVGCFSMLQEDHILTLSSSPRHENSLFSQYEMHCWHYAKPNSWLFIHHCASTCKTVSRFIHVYPVMCWKQQADMHNSKDQIMAQKKNKQDVSKMVNVLSSWIEQETLRSLGWVNFTRWAELIYKNTFNNKAQDLYLHRPVPYPPWYSQILSSVNTNPVNPAGCIYHSKTPITETATLSETLQTDGIHKKLHPSGGQCLQIFSIQMVFLLESQEITTGQGLVLHSWQISSDLVL